MAKSRASVEAKMSAFVKSKADAKAMVADFLADLDRVLSVVDDDEKFYVYLAVTTRDIDR